MENSNAREEEKFIEKSQDEIDVRLGTSTRAKDDNENKNNSEKRKHPLSFWKRKKVSYCYS